MATKIDKRKFNRTNKIAQNSNTRTPGERSSGGSEHSRRSVSVNTVHLETRREESTSVQPKITETLCTAGEVQTGGSGHGSDASPTRKLHDETRFTGCILHGAHTRATQEVPKTAISEQNIRIPMSSIRSFTCPESFHTIAQACGSSAACVRDPTCDLLGRHPDHASGSTGDCQDFQYGSSTIGELGMPYQTGEMLPPSNSSTSILRSPPRFQEDDHCSTDGEGSKPSGRECQSIKEQKLLNAPISCNDWQNESNVENRYPPSSPTLSGLTASIYQMSSPVGTSHTIPASSSSSRLASTGRVKMVDLSDDFTTQRCSTPSPANRYDNRDGCLYQRLGSSMQRHTDGGGGGGASANPPTISTTWN